MALNIEPAVVPVVTTFVIGFFISIIIFIVYFYFEGRDLYRLTFDDGSVIYNQDGIVMSSDRTTLQIFNITNKLHYISSHTFFNEEGEKIESSAIKFNGTSKLYLNKSHAGSINPLIIRISVSPYTRGEFHGWVILNNLQDNSDTYVPAVISTVPYVWAPIFLITGGVCASVCIWEVFRYHRSGIPQTTKEIKKVEEIRRKPEFIAEFFSSNVNDLSGNKFDTDNFVNNMKEKIERRSANYILRSQQPITRRIAFMEIIPSILGISFGLFTTFQNSIPNLLVFDSYHVAILFGIGLGAGSLKELVDKDSDN